MCIVLTRVLAGCALNTTQLISAHCGRSKAQLWLAR